MNDLKMYLKPDVIVEPLVNSWYAWPHLVAPATAAMIIANSQVKIMESYIRAPNVHAAAVRNPAMKGGPFLDFEGRRVNEIDELLKKTLKAQAIQISFAEAIKNLNEMLLGEANGQSLEGLYERVPSLLRGYVELVYDLNHRPSFRFIEGLLYRSQFYDETSQSLALSLNDSSGRSFVFSTPRTEDPTHLHLKIPFAHQGIDELFAMRRVPKSLTCSKEILGIPKEQDELFNSFFTEEPPTDAPDPGSLRVRYLGHASVLIEANGMNILTDPVIGYESMGGVAPFSFADLPQRIDLVLLTHTHADHVVLETLLQLRHKITTIIVPKSGGGCLEDPSLKLILKNIGFENVVEIDDIETLEIEAGSITGVPFFGEHADLNVRSKTGYLVSLGKNNILCIADSRNLDTCLYEKLHEVVGDVDVLFIGMECDGAPLSWIYGSLLLKPLERKMDQSRRLSASDCDRALDIISRLHCKQVYVYAMGQEPWLSFLTSIRYTEESKPIVESNKLIQACRARGIHAQRLLGVEEIGF